MHFDQLLRVRGVAHEEEYSFCAQVEGDGLSLLDNDGLFIDGLEQLIRTQMAIVHARITPTFLLDGRTRPRGWRLVGSYIFYHLVLLRKH